MSQWAVSYYVGMNQKLYEYIIKKLFWGTVSWSEFWKLKVLCADSVLMLYSTLTFDSVAQQELKTADNLERKVKKY